MTEIIGLAGYAQAGKDSVAKVLGYQKVAFADPLREMMAHLNPIVENKETGDFKRYNDWMELIGYEATKKHTTAREFMVKLGGGAREILDSNIWLDIGHKRIVANIAAGHPVVVTDVRYLNEAHMVRSLGGEVWFVDRPGIEAANEEEARTIREMIDASLVDRSFYNNGGLDDLPSKVNDTLAFRQMDSRRWDVV